MFTKTSHGKVDNQPISDTQSSQCAPFDYYFKGAAPAGDGPDVLEAMDDLATAMIDQGSGGKQNSQVPPVFTYLGQFIDHDITAGTDRDQGVEQIDTATLTPRDRDEVVASRINFRSGRLDLDSLYGSSSVAAASNNSDVGFLAKLQKAMRYPPDQAKMRIAFFSPKTAGVKLPRDRAGDLLRFGKLTGGKTPEITQADLAGLSPKLKPIFTEADGTPRIHRAVIGEGRNDENLIIAQLHLAMLRFHNRVVDSCDDSDIVNQGREAVFNWARQNVTRTYQWLIVNEYLPTLCNPSALSWVISNGAPLYQALFDAHGGCTDGRFVLPLEFSTAAFRFGHSTVRPAYDWNKFFGRNDKGTCISPRATFQDMFAYTGSGRLKGTSKRLPGTLGVEWERMSAAVTPQLPDRATRLIDTRLSLPLFDLPSESSMTNAILKNLALRNLRRGLMLNLPSAQDCIAKLNSDFGLSLPVLTSAQLGEGPIHDVLERGGFLTATPLWYYVLREAEVLEGGERLGPLGSHLVAETLVGLLINDPTSYWNTPGSDSGRWHPQDGAQPSNVPVTSIRALFRSAKLL